jgi:protein-S-isoprenylcysteine O-methyltransferase Ste14
MTDSTSLVIVCCWVAWAVYWVITAFSTKRTIERGGIIGYRVVALVLVAASFVIVRIAHGSPQSRLWQTSLAVEIVSDCIVLAGTAFAVWARITLGRNWSAEVTLKDDHELIESGPYALARHPIYTGLISMALGTALNVGRVIGLVVLVGLCGGLWWKARQEEQIMSRQFPDAYLAYKKRVRAIIPFVLLLVLALAPLPASAATARTRSCSSPATARRRCALTLRIDVRDQTSVHACPCSGSFKVHESHLHRGAPTGAVVGNPLRSRLVVGMTLPVPCDGGLHRVASPTRSSL